MARCLYSPEKGKNLFDSLRDSFGYEVAKKAYLTAINKDFQNTYKNEIKLDEEGVPSIDSLMEIPYFVSIIGNDNIVNSKKKQFKDKRDTIENYEEAVNEANVFNSDPKNTNYVAIVRVSDGKIVADVVDKTVNNIKIANEQYKRLQLNKRIERELGSVGITIGLLSQEEAKSGRLGVTDFTIAQNIANGAVEMIRLANNVKGVNALPEEFCHVVIGANRNKPLVKRTIELLKKDESLMRKILGGQYDTVSSFYNGNLDMIAEEAAGQMLRDILDDSAVNEVKGNSLFQRFVNFIVGLFKGFNADDVNSRFKEVQNNLNEISKGMFNGKYRVTVDKVSASHRNVMFNSIDTQLTNNKEVLKKAAEAEAKRHHLIKYVKKESQEPIISMLLDKIDTDNVSDTIDGMFEYISFVKGELKDCLDNLKIVEEGKAGNVEYNINERAEILRSIRQYIDSYTPFIEGMSKIFLTEKKDAEITSKTGDSLFEVDVDGHKQNMTLKEFFNTFVDLQNEVQAAYDIQLKSIVKEFLSGYFDHDIKVSFDGTKTKNLDDILKFDRLDISFTDRWLDSMGTTNSEIHQLLNNIVMANKDKARLNTIEMNRHVIALRKKAISMGITDFSWMFEQFDDGNKTGLLISELKVSQFRKNKDEFDKYLDKKYGRNPVGEKRINKQKEYVDWITENCEDPLSMAPKKDKYENKIYTTKLTTNQKKILKEYIDLKAKADELYGNDSYAIVAVQLRKSGLQRITDSDSAEKAWENTKNAFLDQFVVQEDDQELYGDDSTRSLLDYNGREVMRLPKLLRSKLKDPNELSDDVFGALLQYNFCANEFSSMNDIVHTMESVRDYMYDEDNTKIYEASGLKEKTEKYLVGKEMAEHKVQKKNSYFLQKLDDFYAGQFYMRHKTEPTIINENVSATKLASTAIKFAALAQLGGNLLANLANVNTGVAMINIEAFCGQYTSAKSLGKADLYYASKVPKVISQLASIEKDNDIELISEYFGYRQDMYKKIKENGNAGIRGVLSRFFGNVTLFAGQEAGDHWLYNRMAISMMMDKDVVFNGKTVKLFDLINNSFDVDEKTGLRKLVFPSEVYYPNGKLFDPTRFGRQIAHVCGGLFGEGYSIDDDNSANRYVFGSMLMYLHKWIKPQFNKRFMNQQYSDIMDEMEEGYWRTFGRLILDVSYELRRGQFQIPANWKNMSSTEKYNLRRCLVEFLQVMALYAILAFGFGDDPDKNKPKNKVYSTLYDVLYYNFKRAEHEVGGLLPSLTMVQEFTRTIENPMPVLGEINRLSALIKLAFPWNWELFGEEITRGKWKGYTQAEKIFYRSPIPFIRQIQEFRDMADGLDEELLFYTKN